MKSALITGITGQDGSYLAELLLDKDYKIIGLKRRTSTNNLMRLSACINHPNFTLIEGEISDSGCIYDIVNKYQPDEIYNLAAQSHVGTSFDQPDFTFQTNALGPLYFLEAIRRFSPRSKFYQASTSEMFGNNYTELLDGYDGRTVEGKYQDEKTPFQPQSPYAIAKTAAHHLVNVYRGAYNIFGCSGISFNHESPLRGEQFVTRKITIGLSQIKLAILGVQLAWANSPFGGKGNDLAKIAELRVSIAETGKALVEVGVNALNAGKDIVTNFGDAVGEIVDMGKMAIEGISEISIKSNIELAKATTAAANSSKLAEAAIQGLI